MSPQALRTRRATFGIVTLLVVLSMLASLGNSIAAADKPMPTKADVSYGPHPHQLLDIYLPSEGPGPFPVLVWYGGLWKPAKHVPDVNRFFRSGCAVVGVQMRVMQDAIDARLQPPVSVCLLDGRRAVQFLRLHAAEWNLDANRIAVAGGSQGALPALYVGCAGERADAKSNDPVERVSSKVSCVGAWRSQPSIDPRQMREWVPGVQWGAPAFGCSFAESLKRRDEFWPWIQEWSPESLVDKNSPPIYFENNWGLLKPDTVEEMDFKVHAPQWALGFQKIARERGATCYVKFPGHPSENYADMWEFLIEQLRQK